MFYTDTCSFSADLFSREGDIGIRMQTGLKSLSTRDANLRAGLNERGISL